VGSSKTKSRLVIAVPTYCLIYLDMRTTYYHLRNVLGKFTHTQFRMICWTSRAKKKNTGESQAAEETVQQINGDPSRLVDSFPFPCLASVVHQARVRRPRWSSRCVCPRAKRRVNCSPKANKTQPTSFSILADLVKEDRNAVSWTSSYSCGSG
jgi:hypothetical protein